MNGECGQETTGFSISSMTLGKRFGSPALLTAARLTGREGKQSDMAQIKVIHNPVGETLTVYWDDPERVEVCEEVGHRLILIKDMQGEVIGFERLYFKPKPTPQELGVVLQTAKT
jgi:hypothetical protein